MKIDEWAREREKKNFSKSIQTLQTNDAQDDDGFDHEFILRAKTYIYIYCVYVHMNVLQYVNSIHEMCEIV